MGSSAVKAINQTAYSAYSVNVSKNGGESFGKIMNQSLKSKNFDTKGNTVANTVKTSSYAGNKVKKSDDGNTKSVGKQDNTKKVNPKTDRKSSASTDNKNSIEDSKISDAIDEIKDYVKQKFGLTDDQLDEIMKNIGMVITDLLQPSKITDLIVNITGADNALQIITDSNLSQMLKDIVSFTQNIMSGFDEDKIQNVVEMLNNTDDFNSGVSSEDIPVENTIAANTVSNEQNDTQSQESDSSEMSNLEQLIDSKTTYSSEVSAQSGKDDNKNLLNGKETDSNDKTSIFSQNLAQSVVNSFDETITQQITSDGAVQIVRQVVDAIKVTNTQTLQNIEVQLNPEHLGKVNLSVTSKNGIITAEIVTQNEQVKRAVESQMTILKERFEAQGIKVESVEVVVQNHSFESGQNFSGNGTKENNSSKSRRHINMDEFSMLENDESESDDNGKTVMNENSSVEYSA